MSVAQLVNLRKSKHVQLAALPEILHRSSFYKAIELGNLVRPNSQAITRFQNSGMSSNELKTVINSGLTTFLLHCEARIASNLGLGFYTIGPCGEELLSASSLHLKHSDACALHYRHVSNAVLRQLSNGKTLEQICLDRARGFVCSTEDPITGGKHCSVGGGKYDFLVTSTLASQAPPAVGRGLAVALSNKLLDNGFFAKDAISYVSVGDGSINNAHFLAAVNLAKYAAHRNMKCPVVFAVSNNEKCISLKGYGYINEFAAKCGMSTFVADGSDVSDVYSQSKAAMDYTRDLSRPSLLLFQNLPRRFGHAATDRQFAYMTAEEIAAEADKDPFAGACGLALELGVFTQQELLTQFQAIQDIVERAFDAAGDEAKITSRAALELTNSSPLVSLPENQQVPAVSRVVNPWASRAAASSPAAAANRPDSMRKHMTRVFDEILEKQKDVIYIGEDVQHGGYYLVTDGLASKYPLRVRDFPPDETTLLGAGMGFSQAGFTPIVEIPYAKYLDCAADMFNEAIISNWLSNGKQPNGMVVRLQGFDKGIFGGNFHTHNQLSIPPGLDVVCFSNGADYARGMRYAIRQARGGRVVMSVDSTDLLNRRHLLEENKDEILLTPFPADDSELTFDNVISYTRRPSNGFKANGKKSVAIVSYGNGVPTSLLAMNKLCESHGFDPNNIVVIDCPYLTAPPSDLGALLQSKSWSFESVIFADVCKQGAGMPLGGHAIQLQNEGKLSFKWRAIGAANTYNPLGRSITFLTTDDIINAVLTVQSSHD